MKKFRARAGAPLWRSVHTRLLAGLIALLLPTFTGGVNAAGTVLVGDQNIAGTVDWNAPGIAEAFRATATASGSVTSLSVYVNAASTGTIVAGLYIDSGGTPGTLLTQGSLSKPVTGWNTIAVPPANVTGGSVYWFALMSPVGSVTVKYRDTGSSGMRSEESAQTNLTTLPATWTSGSAWLSSPVSAYASAAATPQPVLSVSPSSLIFSAIEGGANPPPASLTVSNTGSGTLNFTDGVDQGWLQAAPTSGSAPPAQTVQITATTGTLAAGSYKGNVTVTATGAGGSPATIPVTFTVSPPSPPPPTGSDWPTYGHDPMRSGNAAGESMITSSTVNQLGLKWSTALDGDVTAQPLFVSAVQAGGQTRDVVITATAANSVYAVDAANGTVIWRRNFGPSDGTGTVPGGFGIEAAPVIDRTTGRVYTVSGDGIFRTLSLAAGTDAAAALPLITDNVLTNKVWGGLNLVGGSIYVPTASDGNDIRPWRGRIFKVDVSGAAPVLAQTFVVVPSIPAPDGGGGVWGYGGVSVDPTTGRVYAASGADDKNPEGYTPDAGRMLALDANLNLLGSFEPNHSGPCNQIGGGSTCDQDFGATPILYQPPGCPLLAAAVSKDGHIYVSRVNDLAASAPPIQILALNIPFDGPGVGGMIGVPAYWPTGNMLFVTDAGPGINGINAGVVGLAVNPAPGCDLTVAWSVQLPSVGQDQPPSDPTVADGLVFVGSPSGGVVIAYDGATGAELWSSGSSITGATFAAPMVAAGSLYVGSWDGFSATGGGHLRAFALGAAPPPPPPGSLLLGTQTLEGTLDDNALGSAEAFQVTATTSGTVTKLQIYLAASSTGTTLVAGLYADAAGRPGALIAQGSSSQLTAGAWNVVSIPGAVVSAGTPYWLAILGTQSGTLEFLDGTGCTSEMSQQTNLTSLPATWVSGTAYPSCPLSAYGSTGP
jgi:outer membrane protein assembly factor BamB